MSDLRRIRAKDILQELEFVTSRSSGPGGQNVNKVNSRVTLRFDILHSAVLNDQQRLRIQQQLASRITAAGVLQLSSDSKRSQLQNKEVVLARLDKLLAKAFKPEKVRKKTRPTRASKEKRLQEKRRQSEKKKWRRGE